MNIELSGKNKTVADLVDKVNDDSVQMTMEDILTALGINADEGGSE